MIKYSVAKKIFLTLILFTGIATGYLMGNAATTHSLPDLTLTEILSPLAGAKRQVIGFLPYWLLDRAQTDYSRFINQLDYFGLTAAPDGTIVKELNPGEAEPGWYNLNSGKLDPFFQNAKDHQIKLGLVVFSSDETAIGQLISQPANHAHKLVEAVGPLMKQYGFSELNLDIESVLTASDEARQNFTTLVKTIRQDMTEQNLGRLSIDVSPIVLVKPYLVDVAAVAPTVDAVILMTYDYHYAGSIVTGPVAPVNGAGTEAEFDTATAIALARKILPPEKIILGLPLYGYRWETLTDNPRSAVLVGSGISISNQKAEEFIASCASCSAQIDHYGQESYVIYRDQDTDTYYQLFYPDQMATAAKLKLAESGRLGGVALWALGYEGKTILTPLENYRSTWR